EAWASVPLSQLLGGSQLLLDQLQPGIPEAGIGEVDADHRAKLLWAARAAGGQQLEVARGKRAPLLEVAAVDREGQQLPVCIRVHVARGVDEVGDVGPPHAVALGD